MGSGSRVEYECPGCGNRVTLPQMHLSTFEEPVVCQLQSKHDSDEPLVMYPDQQLPTKSVAYHSDNVSGGN